MSVLVENPLGTTQEYQPPLTPLTPNTLPSPLAELPKNPSQIATSQEVVTTVHVVAANHLAKIGSDAQVADSTPPAGGKLTNNGSNVWGKLSFENGDTYEGELCNGQPNGKGTLIGANGSKYVGEFRYGQPHGKGTLSYKNGNEYVGEWRDGKRHGKGKLTFTDGKKFEGEFVGGQPIKGKLYFPNGDKYKGPFLNGQPNGKGKWTYANGDVYRGEFRDGQPNGIGKLSYKNANKCEGEFRDGQLYGIMKLSYKNGNKYVGECLNGQPHGKGKLTTADGNEYEGEFRDGKHISGNGKITLASGDKYVGELHHGQPTGQGTIFYANKSRYEGECLDGLPHGKGKLFLSNGDVYEGEFLYGKLKETGTVKLSFANADTFEGEIRNNQPHKGKLTYANGTEYVGPFRHGKPHGEGVLLTNGDKYIGEFRDGLSHGNGTLIFKDGSTYVGPFRNNKPHGEGIYTSDGGVSNKLQFQNGCAITDISHLRDTLFIQLLSQQFASNSMGHYPVGIMAAFLTKNGYTQVGQALTLANRYKLACDSPEREQRLAEDILSKLKRPNQPVLLSLDSKGHAMGLQMKQTVEGFVDFEIYNSGFGLQNHHRAGDKKFATAWKVRVPLKDLTANQLKQFLGTFETANDAYVAVRNLPGAEPIAPGPGTILQKPQQANNCSLWWMFAYLKNNMPPQEYAKMRLQLYTESLENAKQAAVPNQKLIDALQKKVDKLTKKA